MEFFVKVQAAVGLCGEEMLSSTIAAKILRLR